MSSIFSNDENIVKPQVDLNGATIRLLNKGTFFTLYLVKNHARFLVRKQLSEDYKDAEDADTYRNILRKEFEIGQQLDHPNIVRYVAISDDEKGLYVFTDYLKGESIKTLLEKNNKALNSTPAFINKLVQDLAKAFVYLHENGIYHGDVSTSNIIYNSDTKKFFLIDLGFAVKDNYVKHGGGTYNFTAPEALSAPDKINASSDVFSFGKVLEQICIHTATNRYHLFIQKCCELEQGKRHQDFDVLLADFTKQEKRKKLFEIIKRVFVVTILSMFLFLFLVLLSYEFIANYQSNTKPRVRTIDIYKTKIKAFDSKDVVTKGLNTNFNNVKHKKIHVSTVPKSIWIDTVVRKYSFLTLFKQRMKDKANLMDIYQMRNARVNCIVETYRKYESFMSSGYYNSNEKAMIEGAYHKNYFQEFQQSEALIKNWIGSQ